MSSVLLGKPGSPSLLTPHSCLSWGGSEENLNRNRKPGNLGLSPLARAPVAHMAPRTCFFCQGTQQATVSHTQKTTALPGSQSSREVPEWGWGLGNQCLPACMLLRSGGLKQRQQKRQRELPPLPQLLPAELGCDTPGPLTPRKLVT